VHLYVDYKYVLMMCSIWREEAYLMTNELARGLRVRDTSKRTDPTAASGFTFVRLLLARTYARI